MLEGITVLTQETVEVFTWGFSMPGMISAVMAVLFLISSVVLSVNNYDEGVAAILLLTICTIIASVFFFHHAELDETYEKYKVTIDSSVSLQEFNEQYEILNQEGKIFTIREKEKGES